MTLRRALAAAAMGASAAALFALVLREEDRRPLRSPRRARALRQMNNVILGGGSLMAAAAVHRMALAPLLSKDAGQWGLVRLLPRRWRPVVGFLALDWAMYWWHRWAHLVPALWRLHRVHHVDLDLDVSTALRFHAVDQLVSAPMRMAMIVLIGPDAKTHAMWSRFFFASVLFHHANIRLPRRLEARLETVLTTPRMHGIHHMARRDATDSNWSSGISLWDRLHGSYRRDLGANAFRMGVAGYPDDISLGTALRLPLYETRDDWETGTGPAAASAARRRDSSAHR